MSGLSTQSYNGLQPPGYPSTPTVPVNPGGILPQQGLIQTPVAAKSMFDQAKDLKKNPWAITCGVLIVILLCLFGAYYIGWIPCKGQSTPSNTEIDALVKQIEL